MSEPISTGEQELAEADRRDSDRELVDATLGATIVWLYGTLLLVVAVVVLIAGGWQMAAPLFAVGVLLSPKAIRALRRRRAAATLAKEGTPRGRLEKEWPQAQSSESSSYSTGR